MKKIIILLIFGLVLAGCSSLTKGIDSAQEAADQVQETSKEAGEKLDEIEEKKGETERDLAILKAKEVFLRKKAEGVNMADGPCLSNDLIDGWVLDIGHNPRQAVDDKPGNQCAAYREGQAQHFVELDEKGNLIKAE
ncbi:hypothetical protein KKH43_05750 [Patescibacteria group bacterium]|nr:hypothetical protein [Patescibacteria group bacterium]